MLRGCLLSRKPLHVVDVLPQRFGDLARRVDLLGIGIHQHLQQHLRMVTRGASPFVLPQQGAQVQPVYHLAHHPHQVSWLNEMIVTGWQQIGLAHHVWFEHWSGRFPFHSPIESPFPQKRNGLSPTFWTAPE